jgi:sterol 14-demethylase
MGLLQELGDSPLVQQFLVQSIAFQVGVAFAGIVVLSVVLNVASQILFKNPNEPPMVFHWFPFIGNTITYGMNPPKFFDENRKKVRGPDDCHANRIG